MRGVNAIPRSSPTGTESAALTRLAVTPNAFTGGTQLASSVAPPGRVSAARGRGSTGARFVLSVFWKPPVRCARDSGGMYDSSSPTAPDHAGPPGATPTGENAIAAE